MMTVSMQDKKSKKPVSPATVNGEKIDIGINRKKRLIKHLKHDAVIKTAVFAAGMFMAFSFVFGITLAPTNDMFSALHKGDLIIYYRPGRIINTDVVLYEAPDGSMQTGRVEGTEGELVGATDGGMLTVNGNIQPVQKRSGLYDETYIGKNDISGEIGSGEYLILGDSRETAEDSRAFGLIPREAIRGKVFTIVRRRPL